MSESVRYWRDPSFGGIDLLRACYEKHTFTTHAHDEFVLSAFESGSEKFIVGGEVYLALPGSVVFMPPLVEHNGAAGSVDGWSYRSFYPAPELVDLALGMKLVSRKSVFEIGVYITAAPAIFGAVIAAHKLFEAGANILEKEAAFAHALGLVIDSMAGIPSSAPSYTSDNNPIVRAAKQYIETHYASELSVSDVAEAVNASSSHLMRVFHASTGQHIHGFVTQVRLRHARNLLLAGESPADVAYATGFVDQSHLIRRFKQVFGATPGRYVRDTRPLERLQVAQQ